MNWYQFVVHSMSWLYFTMVDVDSVDVRFCSWIASYKIFGRNIFASQGLLIQDPNCLSEFVSLIHHQVGLRLILCLLHTTTYPFNGPLTPFAESKNYLIKFFKLYYLNKYHLSSIPSFPWKLSVKSPKQFNMYFQQIILDICNNFVLILCWGNIRMRHLRKIRTVRNHLNYLS